MEGIPAPDMASYKRRKEEELGLASGTISQPPTKRPKMDYRQPTDAELAAQLAAHKTLMAGNDAPSLAPSGPAVFGAPTAFAPPFPPPAGTFAPPPFAPGGAPIHLGTGPFPPAATASRPPAATGSPAPSLPPPPQAAAPATEPGNPPLRVPVANYTNPPMKDGTALVYNNANQSPASLVSLLHLTLAKAFLWLLGRVPSTRYQIHRILGSFKASPVSCRRSGTYLVPYSLSVC